MVCPPVIVAHSRLRRACLDTPVPLAGDCAVEDGVYRFGGLFREEREVGSVLLDLCQEPRVVHAAEGFKHFGVHLGLGWIYIYICRYTQVL